MPTRKHEHEEVFPVSPERLFALLHRPSAIRGWWGVARAVVLALPGGVWAAAWGADEDDPDYITTATIREFDPPRRMVLCDYRYQAKTGPLPFTADFVTEFLVQPDHRQQQQRLDAPAMNVRQSFTLEVNVRHFVGQDLLADAD